MSGWSARPGRRKPHTASRSWRWGKLQADSPGGKCAGDSRAIRRRYRSGLPHRQHRRRIELTPGYFQITATPHLAVYDPTVQFEFWFSEKRIADIRQVETTARYLGTALYWIAASINIKPGHDYYFYIRSVNTVGKSAFVEAVGQPSDDACRLSGFFQRRDKGKPIWLRSWGRRLITVSLRLTLKSGRPLRMSAMKSRRPSIRNWKTRVRQSADTEGSG